MSLHLPKPIQLFMSSENIHGPDMVADCFAPDATVRDDWLSKKSMLSKDPLVKLHGEPHVLFNERRASVRD